MHKFRVFNFVRRDDGVAFSGGTFAPDLFELDEGTLRDRGAGLIVALALSLGLWAAIWLVVASFVWG